MLHYAVMFFVIALVAALFGFGGIAAGATSVAQTLFILFAIFAVGGFLFTFIKKQWRRHTARHAVRPRSPTPTERKFS